MTTPADVTARIYADSEITGQVVRVIDEAKHRLAIVSPYVDRVIHAEQAIIRAKKNGARVVVFARQDGQTIGGNGSKEALEWFRANDIEVEGVPNLHAKFYMNEHEAVVTSMNLLKSSWSSSFELGFLVQGEAHKQLVEYLTKRLRVWSTALTTETSQGDAKSKLREKSTPYRARTLSRSARTGQKETSFFGSIVSAVKDAISAQAGYCIRCGEPMTARDADAGKVLCASDYREWAMYKNPEYAESYCNTCGQRRKTTYSKPQCRKCYSNGT